MRIGLIAMSGVRVRTPELIELGVTLPQFVNRGEVIASLPSLGLLTVAGLTPYHVDVCYREVADVPPESDELEPFDLVGISSFSAQMDEAYALADRYRAEGTPVVLGGIHVTLNADEAQRHADSIVVGGAEGAWPRLVRDFENGAMQPRYEGLRAGVFETEHYAAPRFDLLAGRQYNRYTTQTSRGCPRSCEFCAASLRITDSFQQKPVDLVVEEIHTVLEMADRPFFEFADDNTFVNHRWGKEFLRAIQPLGIHWFTETEITVAEDLELLDLLADSGCRQVLIGLESPRSKSLRNLDPANFKAGQTGFYLEAIELLQSRGVTVNGCFILGLDDHTPEIFAEVRDFIDESKLLEVQLTVLTPFPGTPLYDRLAAEGRLLTPRFWDRCTLFDVNYQPKNMSVVELEAGLRWLFQEVYNEKALARRQRHYMEQIKPLL